MLQISFFENQRSFRPGERIAGTVRWQLDKAPKSITIGLWWRTSGKGTEESEQVESTTFDHPQRAEQREFSFVAPSEPYSFSGRLISVRWSLEATFEPGDETEYEEIVIGPKGEEIILDSLPVEPVKIAGWSITPRG